MSSTLNFRLATKRFQEDLQFPQSRRVVSPRDKCTYLKVIQANGALWTFIRRNVVASDLEGKQPRNGWDG